MGAKIKGIHFYIFYVPSSVKVKDFENILYILHAVREHIPAVIAGDFNAWAVDWGSIVTDARGQASSKTFTHWTWFC